MCSHGSLSCATSELGLKPLDPPRPLQSGQRETRALVQKAGKSCGATKASGLFLLGLPTRPGSLLKPCVVLSEGKLTTSTISGISPSVLLSVCPHNVRPGL